VDRPSYTLAGEGDLRERIARGELDAAAVAMLAADAQMLAGLSGLPIRSQVQALRFAVDALQWTELHPAKQLRVDLEPQLFKGAA
jgi:hypothetical protein